MENFNKLQIIIYQEKNVINVVFYQELKKEQRQQTNLLKKQKKNMEINLIIQKQIITIVMNKL